MLAFTKMQSLGNDFILVDGVRRPFELDKDQIRYLADRHFGIGCDQVLVAEPTNSSADFAMRIFNADGSEADHCGNGARCFARFVYEEGLSDKRKLVVLLRSRTINVEIEDDWQVVVEMGEPLFDPSKIPFESDEKKAVYELEVCNEIYKVHVVSMGNPHVVILVDDVKAVDVGSLGAAIERHSRFPQGVNVGFVSPITRNNIHLRVWERGVGETLACGSGACAAVVSCHRAGQVNDQVLVELPGGLLDVRWPGRGSVFLKGSAVNVFRGEINLALV